MKKLIEQRRLITFFVKINDVKLLYKFEKYILYEQGFYRQRKKGEIMCIVN